MPPKAFRQIKARGAKKTNTTNHPKQQGWRGK